LADSAGSIATVATTSSWVSVSGNAVSKAYAYERSWVATARTASRRPRSLRVAVWSAHSWAGVPSNERT
jgi:hypothetical protein